MNKGDFSGIALVVALGLANQPTKELYSSLINQADQSTRETGEIKSKHQSQNLFKNSDFYRRNAR